MPAKVRKKRKDQVRPANALERRIKDYSLAAMGIGAVAFAPAASAAVVTSGVINHNVPVNIFYDLDFGGHHVIDIDNFGGGTVFGVSATAGKSSGRVFVGAALGSKNRASPIKVGQSIPGKLPSFTTKVLLASTTDVVSSWTGFLGTNYIGFSFGSGANIHYGWVQLSITQSATDGPYTVTVVQAAYETVAGKPLAAGATSDSPSPTPAPNTLWLTALGAAGLASLEAMRRRKRA